MSPFEAKYGSCAGGSKGLDPPLWRLGGEGDLRWLGPLDDSELTRRTGLRGRRGCAFAIGTVFFAGDCSRGMAVGGGWKAYCACGGAEAGGGAAYPSDFKL